MCISKSETYALAKGNIYRILAKRIWHRDWERERGGERVKLYTERTNNFQQ